MLNNLIQELLKADIAPESIEQILQQGKRISVKSQAKLIEPGQVCDKAYFILKGGFVCRYIDDELEIEKTINFYLHDFHPFMGCVDSFFSGAKTQCELRAITQSEVFEFTKKDIDIFTNKDIRLLNFYHTLVTTALQEENDFKLKIIAYSSEQLYHYLITHCPVIIQKVPSKYVAEFMGITSEWLSKLKHRI